VTWARYGRSEPSPWRVLTSRIRATSEDDTGDQQVPEAASPDDDRLLTALSAVREMAGVRQRAADSAGRADRLSATGLGLGYLVIAVGIALVAPPPTVGEAVILLLLVLLYVIAYRTEFVATGGSTVPTEPVLVGLLLATPLHLVPLSVMAALLVAGVGAQEAGSRAGNLLARIIPGWHCLGPVAVLWLFPPGPPRLGAWPVYLLALGAQFALDGGSAAVRSLALAVPLRRLAAGLRWAFTVDTLLAPLGLCVVVAARDEPVALALLAAPIVLVRLLSRDRSEQVETAVTLGTAYHAVQEEARVDVLTGLANRRAWFEALEAAQRRAATEPVVVVALIADVDGLKRVNDTLGHDLGDELIRRVGRAVADAGPVGAVTARLGGDEFGMLATVPEGSDVPGLLLSGVRASLARHPGVAGAPLSASLGVASCPPAHDVPEAVTLADLASAHDKIVRRAGR